MSESRQSGTSLEKTAQRTVDALGEGLLGWLSFASFSLASKENEDHIAYEELWIEEGVGSRKIEKNGIWIWKGKYSALKPEPIEHQVSGAAVFSAV